MKKARYFPFERNRYFYGKLLTVRDFESEQKYVNDKRRLLNRLIHGGGVIAGMQVIAVDDKSISVEMGAALDYQGREIIIPSPVLLKLSMIEGFTNNEYAKNVYLYAAYDEKGKEPVHSISNSVVRTEEVSEYNRILESYKLYISEKAPDPAKLEYSHFYESISMIYQDDHVRIYQKTPKYVNPDEVFEVTLIVEKTLQTQQINLEYEIASELFTPVGTNGSQWISFLEPLGGHETEYIQKYYLRAQNTPSAKGTLTILQESAKLSIGDKKIVLNNNPVNDIEVISGSIEEKILGDFYEQSLDQTLESNAEQGVCLAKISLLQMGSTYMIEKVENIPFGEYIYNFSLMNRLNQRYGQKAKEPFFVKSTVQELPLDEKPRFSVSFDPDQSEFDFSLGLPKHKVAQDEVSTGKITIRLEKSQKSALRFFLQGEKSYVTDEINHRLGPGNTYIMVGLEEDDDHLLSDLADSSERVFYGSSEVFNDSLYESKLPEVSFGTMVYPKKGTFCIGMKLRRPTEAESITIRWWAFKKKDEDVAKEEWKQAMLEVAAEEKKE